MLDMIATKTNFNHLTITVIIVIVLGLGTSGFFLLINKESYSSIYIIPDSIIYNSNDNSIIYTYGIKSSESGPTDYSLNTYLNNTLIKTKQFTLNTGETLDERDILKLPADVSYPSKISLELSTRTSKEEVHFWLKG